MKFLTALLVSLLSLLASTLGEKSSKSPKSPKITKAPKSSKPCKSSKSVRCVDIVVELTTDDYASETSFTLTDCNTGTDIASVPPPPLVSATTTTFTYTVEDSDFDFTILDSFGDGICCGWGLGSYIITYDGNVVADSDGEFDAFETVLFGANGGSTCPAFANLAVASTSQFQIQGDQIQGEAETTYDISLTPPPDDKASIPNDIPTISIYTIEGDVVASWSDPKDAIAPFFAKHLTENVPDGDYMFELTDQNGATKTGRAVIDRTTN